jgi:hypothetical protein
MIADVGKDAVMPRTRPVRAAAWTVIGVVVAVSLGGCATAAAGGDAADSDSIAARASVLGIAPDLVYMTEADGYDLAPQSVGPSGLDGMSATWFNQTTGAMLTIRTSRGEMTAASCPESPLWDAPDAAVTCTDEDGVWHRSGVGVHEYVAVRDGALIGVGGVGATPTELSAAARAVRVPSEAELERLFSDAPDVSATPVERGDLPDNGDGAPIDLVGPGG